MMATSRVQILPINNISDGDGRTPDTTKFHSEDDYYLAAFGKCWATDQNIVLPGVTYTLDRLPAGYSGWGRKRGDSKHIDRYLWGHPSGVFRSINEALPHFSWLMDGGPANPVPCSCPRCSAKSTPAKRVRPVNNGGSDSNSISSGALNNRPVRPLTAQTPLRPAQPLQLLQHGQFSSSDEAPVARRKQVDEDGVSDAYRAMLDKLKNVGSESSIDEPFREPLSPDAYVGGEKIEELIFKWQDQPPFIPRLGEVVLFVRRLKPDDSIKWSPSVKKFRVYDNATASWAEQTVWEAGVITQEPLESCSEAELIGTSEGKSSINQSGFRIEPLSAPRRHVYVPLHAIRPLALWQQCATEQNTHPTIKEAIITSKSFCVLHNFHFKGTWPSATIFAKALFLGPELIVVGDLVRFLNDDGEVDMMKITSIKLVFLRLHEASNDDQDDRRPYNTVLHVSGHAYSLQPTRSFDVIDKVPASTGLPPELPKGDWFHVTDPANPKMRVEIPYSRVISRYPGDAAMSAWFDTAPTPTASFQPVNNPTTTSPTNDTKTRISRGISGTIAARRHSELHSRQIARSKGKTWFWADTRVEQLDLKEINDRYVGSEMVKTMVVRIDGRDEGEDRSRADLMPQWRAALHALASKSGVEPWRKSQGGQMGPPGVGAVKEVLGGAVSEPQVVAVGDSQPEAESTENDIEAATVPMQEDDEDRPSSSTGSKRSHSDMDVDNDEDDSTQEKARKMQNTLQRRIETIEIEDSD